MPWTIDNGGDGTGGSGGGFYVPTSAPLPFADNAARDTWAAANLDQLINTQTLLQVTGTPDVWWLWLGETNPDTYAADWLDATPIVSGEGSDTPAQVKEKYESNANTNAFTDADRDKAALPFGLLEGEIGVSADLSISNSNFADYRGKIINCHAGTPFTVTLSNVTGGGYIDENLYWFTNSGTATVTIMTGSIPNRPFVGGGAEITIAEGESVVIKGTDDAGQFFNIIASNKAGSSSAGAAFISGVCITKDDGSEVNTIETIDQLTDVPLTLRFNAINSSQFSGGVTLLAQRNGAQQTIASFTGVGDGVNARTVTLNTAQVQALRAGTGAIRFNIIGAGITLEGACIAVEPDPLVNITNAKTFVSAEYYAAQTPTGQIDLLIYEDLNAAAIEMTASGSITLRECEAPVSFVVRVRGIGASFSGAGTVVLLSNFDNPTDGDLLQVIGKGNSFDIFRLSSEYENQEFLKVRRHTLDDGYSSVPTATTTIALTLDNLNLLAKNYILAVQGINIAAFPNVPRGLSALKYDITAAQWAQIGGTGSSIYNYTLTNGDDSRIEYNSIFRVDL